MRTALARLVGMTLLAAACGASDGGGTGPRADFSLSLSPSALTLQRGATDSVTVTISRHNFREAVALSMAGAPPGVSGSFSVATDTGTSSTLHVSVADTAPVGFYDVIVNGLGSPGNRLAVLRLVINDSTVQTVTCLAGQTSPNYRPYRELMPLVSCSVPLYVTGSTAVPTAALRDAGSMLEAMLQHRPDIASSLKAAGTLTGVFAHDETVCDLIYFAQFAGTSLCARGAGGLGGTVTIPVTGCSERNVLKESDDPYLRGQAGGENICVHELAHTIMNIGLSDQDRLRIEQRYDSAVTEGLWTGDYAMENSEEFFGEMSQTYFCANPATPNPLHHGINCAAALQAYDPRTFQLIDGIYRGSADLR
ncbi:MAG TPA: hypothetical protein VL549_05325 [Gemmatimonadales bacterium]|jgi:hypothetical protein|nr:hypothetical protein [Gemmatimonadales bacterium]